MFILQVASEIYPFAKTGGLGDVAGGILRPLAQLGHQVAAFMPLYRRVRDQRLTLRKVAAIDVRAGENVHHAVIHRGEFPGTKIPVFFVEEDSLFDREGLYGGEKGDYPDNAERFITFCRAALEAVVALELPVDVVHAHDWQTALIPVYLKTIYAQTPALARIRSLFTIHNLSYQGVFPSHYMSLTGLDWSLFNWKQLEFWGQINFMKAGLVFADRLTTVSPQYSKEIQTEEFGCGLEGVLRLRAADLQGILNGVDTEEWNPATDKLIPARYTASNPAGKAACKSHLRKRLGLPDSPGPVFGVVSRLVEQKGIDLIAGMLTDFVATESQLVVLGQGEDAMQRLMTDAANKWPDAVSTTIGFDPRLAHEITAGADAILMPSRYEPCGLSQLYSQLYGTVPVVRRTGGLADSVQDGVTGFEFDEASPAALFRAVRKAVEAFRKPAQWKAIEQAGMKLDWSWLRSAREYATLFEKMTVTGKERP